MYFLSYCIRHLTEKLEIKVIKAIRGVSEMKTIRHKVIFAKRNHVQTICI